ncbi:hypothetical protein [uncultured Olegusella sp.]|uniref:hypothetical protein n=1 Tax=uncultured Olegusella sp. TaxID=1979846 RepID=UPI002630EAC6|nr:hypothetical protein [uncultured Olegusella sp.]
MALLTTALAGVGVLVVTTFQKTQIRDQAEPVTSTFSDFTGSSAYSTSRITTGYAVKEPDTEAQDEIEPFASTASLLPLFFDEHNQSYLQNPQATALLKSDAMGDLADEISLLEADGYSVGVVLLDIQTKRQLTYHADEVFYPASSINYRTNYNERLTAQRRKLLICDFQVRGTGVRASPHLREKAVA